MRIHYHRFALPSIVVTLPFQSSAQEISMFLRFAVLISMTLLLQSPVYASELNDSIKQDYDGYLEDLFDHFHRNPELSTVEHETARRMALELSLAGFDVAEGVGGTGVEAGRAGAAVFGLLRRVYR